MTMQTAPYKAPSFSLVDSDGKHSSLEDYNGSWIVLYFYPKDDTPGCTTEACSLRDSRDDIADLGAQVVGVSRDTPADHLLFKQKHSLNFTLLSDPDAAVHKKYGAWGKGMFGHEGVLRRTFLIDPAGIVRKVYGRVNVASHGAKVVEDLQKLVS